MKPSTANQMANAIAAANSGKGKDCWVVRSKWTRSADMTTSEPMTYREAVAKAKAIREGFGFATVERA